MPMGVYPRLPASVRFEKFVDRSGDCHVWIGGKIGKGYGSFNGGYAHRFSYELNKGPIPAELVIDHLCRNRACVNPEHLEAVTPGENIRRGILPSLVRAMKAKITHCPKGHEYTSENTRVTRGKRHCKECGNLAVKAYDEKHRVERMLAARLHREKNGAKPNSARRAKQDRMLAALGMLPDQGDDE